MPWRKTPRWLSLGGAWLALTAGYINAVGFLGAQQHGLTHVTGQVTRLGIELAHANVDGLLRAGALIGWFFCGAVLAGAIIERPELSRGERRYGLALTTEAILLFLASGLLAGEHRWAIHLVAMAAGLQNAMATSYSGAVLRTTHMTGIATDLGILVGHALRGHSAEGPKLRLLLLLFGAFLAGGTLGAWAYPWLGAAVLLPPAGGLLVAGLSARWLNRSADLDAGP